MSASASSSSTLTAPTSLSSLCSSCHAAPPRYRCPRCATATCSLACARMHKTRTLCSGVRDPATYATRAQLATPAGFDRDFNFIAGLERGIERAARDAGCRGISLARTPGISGMSGTPGMAADREGSFRGRGGARGRGRGRGRGGGMGAANGSKGGAGGGPLAKSFAGDGVTVWRAPRGMARERDNRTHWRRKGGGVSWTVEWIDATRRDKSAEGEGEAVVRGLAQVHESITMRAAFAGWLTKRRGVKRKRGGDGDGDGDAQVEATGKEGQNVPSMWTLALEAVDKQTRPAVKVLLPFDPTMRIKDVLKGRTVKEFPTIYAWHDGDLPETEFELLDKLEKPEPLLEQDANEIGKAEGEPIEEAPADEERDEAEATGDIFDGGDDDDDEDPEIDGDDVGNDGDGDDMGNESRELEVEENVKVGADSNLGIGGAIIAALTADSRTEQVI